MNIKNNRKFKYGSIAVIFTCVCIALIVTFNVIFTALAQNFNWYTDMTGEQIFELSDSTGAILEGYREKSNFEVKLIFCMEPDRLDEEYTTRIIHNMAKQFADEFQFIHVEYIDIELHPGAVEQYKKASNTTIARTSMIIACGERAVVQTAKSFFLYDEDDTSTPVAFDAEYKITSAILSIAEDNPIAYFTTGHSEDTESSAMYRLFEDAGFQVKEIDLTKEDPEDSAMVIVINNPKYDFAGHTQTVNEIEKIQKFLDGMGNLMVFMDSGSDISRFTELNELIADWGMAFESSRLYDLEHALSVDGTELIADCSDKETIGASFAASLRDMANPPKIIVNNARPIKALYETNPDGDRKTSAVLTTSSEGTAVAVPFDATDNTAGVKGIYNVMMTGVQQHYVNNIPCKNYVLLAGTSSFADDRYVSSSAYGNRDLIFSMMKAFGKKNVPIDLDAKFFDSEALDLTTSQANRWTIVLSVILPACVFVTGFVVHLRRKHL